MGDFKINVKKYLLYVVVLLVLIWTNAVHSSVSSEDSRYLLKTSKELTDDEKSEYAADGLVFLHQIMLNDDEGIFYYALKEPRDGSQIHNGGRSGAQGSTRHDDQNAGVNAGVKVELLRKKTNVIEIEEEERHKLYPKFVPIINDPEWPNMWHLQKSQRPSMGIQEAWAKGYTGSGIVISITDDGIERTHTDLANKYQASYSYDYANDDSFPDHSSGESHGTNCAGIVAAERNTHCIVGIAFDANLAAVKILDPVQTPTISDEAATLIHSLVNIDIYSNSWGPNDDGVTYTAPSALVEAAFRTGVTTGRSGKGVLYTWASGNGGQNGDDCNCDGYANSIYTIAVASVFINGNPADFSETCTAILAATYGGGVPYPRIYTTEIGDTCTNTFQGTSAATPVASGILALLLQAKSELTWRDVQHLIVETSSLTGLNQAGVVTNAVNKTVSVDFGFGLMNANSLITRAASWVTVPTQVRCDETLVSPASSGTSYLDSTHMVSTCSVRYLEHVRVTITFRAGTRGGVQFFLLSPGGTISHLLHARFYDTTTMTSDETFTFMTVHSWGENPTGTWALRMASANLSMTLHFQSWQLILFGTETDPQPAASSSNGGASTSIIFGAIVGGAAVLGGAAVVGCGAIVYMIKKRKRNAVSP